MTEHLETARACRDGQPLAGMTVLDLGSGPAAGLAAMELADFGARVPGAMRPSTHPIPGAAMGGAAYQAGVQAGVDAEPLLEELGYRAEEIEAPFEKGVLFSAIREGRS